MALAAWTPSLLVAVIGLAGCSGTAADAGVSTTTTIEVVEPVVYRGDVSVLQDLDGVPRLCTGVIEQSLPPHCDGVELVDWDWDAVEGEDIYGASRLGTFEVDVTVDGERLVVLDARGPAGDPNRGPTSTPDFGSPCTEPPGGWPASVDVSRLSFEAYTAFYDYVAAQPDLSAFWVHDTSEPPPGEMGDDRTEVVSNVRFTRNAARHEAEIRAIWGGPICITQGGRAKAELLALRDRLQSELHAIGGGLDERAGRLELTLLLDDPEAQADLDKRFGAGAVVLHSMLVPVTSTQQPDKGE